MQTQRDMLNLLTRVRARLENRKAYEIRQEIAREEGLPNTFLKYQDEAAEKLDQVTDQLRAQVEQQKQKKVQAEIDDEEEDEEETSNAMNKGALVFSLVTLGASALTYTFMNRNKA